MTETYLTRGEAEEIIMAVKVGTYNIDTPDARLKLVYARLLLASQQANSADPISGRLTYNREQTEKFHPERKNDKS